MMRAGLANGEAQSIALPSRRKIMPLVTVTYSSARKAPSLKAEIASAVSDLTARILHKDPKVTAIIVKAVDAADWFAGGKSLAEQKLASYWLHIHVSEGTNTQNKNAASL